MIWKRLNPFALMAGMKFIIFLKPDWDGEDSLFDVISVEGFQNLKNLKQWSIFQCVTRKY